MGSYYAHPVVDRIAGEVAVFDSQGPAVPDRAADLQEICTQQLVQNGKQGYSKSARQLSRSFAARRLTDLVAALDTKEAPSMLQIALETTKIAPPCSNVHQKVNAQSFLCPGPGI